jgi:hypothetical protein
MPAKHPASTVLIASLVLGLLAPGCGHSPATAPASAAALRQTGSESRDVEDSDGASARVAEGDSKPAAPQEPNESLVESHERMLRELAEVAKKARDENNFLEDRSLREARAKLDSLGPSASSNDVWQAKFALALPAYRLGHEQEAIDLFEELLATIDGSAAARNPSNKPKLMFQLGEAYLRHAETQNCCQLYTPESCVFPIAGAGIHQRQEPSRQAIEYFTQTLQSIPPGSPVYNSALWLVNIAYMTVGEYPDGVPPEYLIPPDRFQSDMEFPRFLNISSDIGLDTLSLSGGAVGDDFDNDGDLDLLVSDWGPEGQLKYFVNNGDGTFNNATEQAGLVGITGGINMVQADYDNDGDADVLILRGAWLGEGGRHPNSLLVNLGGGRFIDAAYAAGIAGADFPTQTAAWADYDNDSDLDLYVGNETTDKLAAPSQLFRNNGDGTFADVAVEAGVTNDRFAKAAVWGDYDGDNFPDLYVSNLREANRLYRNNRDGTFTDVAVEAGVVLPLASFPAWFWDYDNDGDLDLYVAAYASDIGDVAASYLGLPVTSELERLYRNNGDGTFTDVAREAKLTRPTAPMGSNFGDLDNDGFLDFYLGTGYPTYYSLMPNVMYVNRGGREFADVTFAGGFGSLQKGHAVVFADFDHDGDQDVFEQMGGALAGDAFVDAFYENPGFGRKWISLELVGTKSNRSAIGARMHVTIVEGGSQRSIYKHVNSGGSFGANPLRQAIGLGNAEQIESVEISWPTTGATQVFEEVESNRFYRVTEGQDRIEVIQRPPFSFHRGEAD